MKFNEYVDILNRKVLNTNKKLAIICIGNSDILWDSIGPKVGSYLIKANRNLNVFGNEKYNICEKKDLLKYTLKLNKKFIIAIDSAKGNENDIYISNSQIKMGNAFNNNNGEIGDLGIKASFSNLENINKFQVNETVKFIAEGILKIV